MLDFLPYVLNGPI